MSGGQKDSTYYVVRVPELVLLHGAQLEAGPRGGGFTQEQLWKLVGASRSHALDAVGALRKDGYLDPTAPLSLGPEMGGVIGVAVGGETIRAGWFDANGRRRAQYVGESVPDRLRRQSRERTLADIATAVNAVIHEATQAADEEHAKQKGNRTRRPLYVDRISHGQPHQALPLLGVAVAWPFPINRYTKEPEGNAVPDSWAKKRLRSLVADRLGLPDDRVHALNTSNAAALAHTFDAIRSVNAISDRRQRASTTVPEYQPAHIAMTIRVAAGIGVGTMVVQAYTHSSFRSFTEAALLEAEDGLAGELGHLRVDDALVELANQGKGDLPPLSCDWECECGQQGHLAAIAGGRGLVSRAEAVSDASLREELGIPADASTRKRDLLSEITRGIDDQSHPILTRALRDAGWLIGRTLSGTVLVLAPSVITFTGSAACLPLIEGFELGVRQNHGFHGRKVALKLDVGASKDFAPAKGAALSVLRRVIYRNLGEFDRLQPKAGKKHLAEGERLFASKMYLIRRGQTLRPLR